MNGSYVLINQFLENPKFMNSSLISLANAFVKKRMLFAAVLMNIRNSNVWELPIVLQKVKIQLLFCILIFNCSVFVIFNSNVSTLEQTIMVKLSSNIIHKLSFAKLQSGTGLNANELKQFLLKYNENRTPTTTDNKIILNETTRKTLKNL